MTLSSRIGLALWLIALALCTPVQAQFNPRAFFEVTKNFAEPSALNVSVTLECNTGLPLWQSFFLLGDGETVTFVVEHFDSGELDCRLTEVVPPGHSVSYDDGTISPVDCEWDSVEYGDELTCDITNEAEDPQALFRVRKIFTDANPEPVNVEIRCNTGFPLEQSFYLAHGHEVTFAVGFFDSGELDCEVTEEVPDGYWANYNDGTSSLINCRWNDLLHGSDVLCTITNTPRPADRDADGVPDDDDNCPDVSNQSQEDFDGDGIGDACDDDIDGDAVANKLDLCPMSQGPKLVDPDTGCSIEQLCPCEGPAGGQEPWPKQNDYLKCVKEASKHLVESGVINKDEYKLLQAEANASQCGF